MYNWPFILNTIAVILLLNNERNGVVPYLRDMNRVMLCINSVVAILSIKFFFI